VEPRAQRTPRDSDRTSVGIAARSTAAAAARLGASAFICLIAGCIIVPIPTDRHTPKSAHTRGEIEKRSLEFLHAGSTTREEVLWEFGEPDALSEDERYFVYRWLTVAGYLVMVGYSAGDVAGMGAKRHDMVLEFDERGVLVRYGEMETLVTEPIGDDVPVDLTLPATLPVLYRASTWKEWGAATLRLEEARVTLAPSNAPNLVVDLQRATIFHFEHRGDDEEFWNSGWLHYRLYYESAEGEIRVARLQVNVLDLPRLAKYLQDQCPGVSITD